MRDSYRPRWFVTLLITCLGRLASAAGPAPVADGIVPVARFVFDSADEFSGEGRKIDGKGVVFGQAGPRPPRERGFAADNKAAMFGSGRGFIQLADPGPDSPFEADRGCLVATVTDDGNGFDAGSADKASSGHFGLRGLSERARRIDAEVTVHSRPGGGTTVAIRLTAPPTLEP